jgi:ATP-dependent DNA helicase RecQ
VRVGRLPPRGETQATPPAELASRERSAPTWSAPTAAARPPRPPFTHETWKEVDRVAQELELGELGSDQRKIIRAALEGKDVVATLPSGLARLPSFVVPAKLLAGPTVVVGSRPHLLRELQDRLQQRRVPTLRFDASLSDSEQARALARLAEGGSPLVLCTPSSLLRGELSRVLGALGVALAVIDDAQHAASSSDQLSPSAAELGFGLERLGFPLTMALLGPAVPETRHEVVDVLRLRSPVIVEGHAVRPNIALDVLEARGEVRQRALVQLALELRRPGIIFAPTAREVDAIYGALAALRLPVHRFHPHLPPGERVGEQLNFLLPGRRAILVATSAFASPTGLVGVGEAALVDRAPSDFGLGVEKRDVRFVIHWAPPASLEQYARELALIGRDGEESMAVLFHDPGERGRHESQLAGSRPSARHLLQLAKALEPSTIDGRARTLEALALSSGSSGRITESMAALLEDVGLAALASGWIRALVPARALMAGAERLAHRLDRLRAREHARLPATAFGRAARRARGRAVRSVRHLSRQRPARVRCAAPRARHHAPPAGRDVHDPSRRQRLRARRDRAGPASAAAHGQARGLLATLSRPRAIVAR